MSKTRETTPWLGRNHNPKTRPVKSGSPTPRQVADTVLQEMRDPGYMVSFYDGDQIRTDDALRILAERVVELEDSSGS